MVDTEDPSEPFQSCFLAYLHIHALTSSKHHQGDVPKHHLAQVERITCGVLGEAGPGRLSICGELVALFSGDDSNTERMLVVWRWTNGQKLGVRSPYFQSHIRVLSLECLDAPLTVAFDSIL